MGERVVLREKKGFFFYGGRRRRGEGGEGGEWVVWSPWWEEWVVGGSWAGKAKDGGGGGSRKGVCMSMSNLGQTHGEVPVAHLGDLLELRARARVEHDTVGAVDVSGDGADFVLLGHVVGVTKEGVGGVGVGKRSFPFFFCSLFSFSPSLPLSLSIFSLLLLTGA